MCVWSVDTIRSLALSLSHSYSLCIVEPEIWASCASPVDGSAVGAATAAAAVQLEFQFRADNRLVWASYASRKKQQQSQQRRSIFVAYFSVGSACVLCCCCGGTARATAAAAVAATRTAQHPLHLQISSVASSSSAAATVETATSKNSLSEFQKRKKNKK